MQFINFTWLRYSRRLAFNYIYSQQCVPTLATLYCVIVCVCVRDVLYLRGCWIISVIENHSRFHSLIMTVFAHDRAREGGGVRISVITTDMEGRLE